MERNSVWGWLMQDRVALVAGCVIAVFAGIIGVWLLSELGWLRKWW